MCNDARITVHYPTSVFSLLASALARSTNSCIFGRVATTMTYRFPASKKDSECELAAASVTAPTIVPAAVLDTSKPPTVPDFVVLRASLLVFVLPLFPCFPSASTSLAFASVSPSAVRLTVGLFPSTYLAFQNQQYKSKPISTDHFARLKVTQNYIAILAHFRYFRNAAFRYFSSESCRF
jgi:hypothetical protein